MARVNVEKIKALRSLNRYDQTVCAAAIGVSREEYSRKENGKTPFNLEQIDALSKLYRVPLWDIVDDLIKPAAEDEKMIKMYEDRIRDLLKINALLEDKLANYEGKKTVLPPNK